MRFSTAGRAGGKGRRHRRPLDLRSASLWAFSSSWRRIRQTAAHSVTSSEETRSSSSATVQPSFSASSK